MATGKATKNAAAKTSKTTTKRSTKTAMKTSGKRAATARAASRKASKGTSSSSRYRVKVRMYRQGLGDCFLITIPRKKGTPYYVVIDCGVILGTKDAGAIMNEVVEHIIATTNGHIDLLAATHEHWDHISGFGQAREIWTDKNRLTVGEVWLSWAENPKDSLARKLQGERQALAMALQAAAARMRLGGDSESAEEVTNLLSFFGAAGTTADALKIVKGLSENLRYCKPQDEPMKLEGTDVRCFVLGPPPDEKFIKKYNPSTKEPETYGMDSMNQYLGALGPALLTSDDNSPFDGRYHIPLPVAQQMPFFQQHYWGEAIDSKEESSSSREGDTSKGGDSSNEGDSSKREDKDPKEKDQSWRRIDGSWLDSSSTLALQLDSATNNTCLVLAFELADGDVLLFAADAQVGNWLSWQGLKWNVDGKEVTGPDLLGRTIFYKVGHHGSHNATLRELGLEEMTSLKLAFVPVDRKMAIKKRWNKMPLNELMDRLNEITKERVVRIDADVPAKLKKSMVSDKLFHEVTL